MAGGPLPGSGAPGRVAAELGAQGGQRRRVGDLVRGGSPGRCRDLVPRVADELGAQGGQRRRMGDLVRGGPRTAAGSVPKVTNAGGRAEDPVLQVAPGPPTSSGPRVATAGGRAGEPVLQVAPGRGAGPGAQGRR